MAWIGIGTNRRSSNSSRSSSSNNCDCYPTIKWQATALDFFYSHRFKFSSLFAMSHVVHDISLGDCYENRKPHHTEEERTTHTHSKKGKKEKKQPKITNYSYTLRNCGNFTKSHSLRKRDGNRQPELKAYNKNCEIFITLQHFWARVYFVLSTTTTTATMGHTANRLDKLSCECKTWRYRNVRQKNTHTHRKYKETTPTTTFVTFNKLNTAPLKYLIKRCSIGIALIICFTSGKSVAFNILPPG